MNALGWTLIHSVWQIAAIAAALIVLLACLRRGSPNVRYLLATVALVSCVVAPLATFARLAPTPSKPVVEMEPTTSTASTPAAAMIVSAPTPPAPAATVRERLEAAFPFVVGAWLIGLFAMTLRLAGGLVAIERLKRKGVLAAPEWGEKVQAIARQMRVKQPVELRIAEGIAVPLVVGVLKVAILLPAATLTKLSPAQVEAILAHELAHVRRLDYLANLVQSVVETILFYHPAVWWISSVVRAEREHCCDDLAIRVIGSRAEYARALVQVEELRTPAPQLALRANGGRLIDRIRRIHTGDRPRTAARPIALALLIGVTVTFGAFRTLYARSPQPAKGKKVVHLTGKVLSDDDKPVAGATVFCTGVVGIPDSPGPEPVMTDRNGRFSFTAEGEFSHLVSAHKPGRGIGAVYSRFEEPLEIRLSRSGPAKVKLNDNALLPLVNMRVRPWQINVDRVSIDDPRLLQRLAVMTNAQGEATLNDLPARGYAILETEHPSFARGPAINLPPSSRATEVRMRPSCEVQGRVTADGKPVANAAIQVVSPKTHVETVRSDADGRFVARRIAPGQAFVTAIAPEELAGQLAPSVAVNLSPSRPATAEVRFQRAAIIQGQVLDASRNPIPGQMLILVPEGPERGQPPRGLQAEPDGRFRFETPAGRYRLMLYAVGGTQKLGAGSIEVSSGELRNFTLTGTPAKPVTRTVAKVIDEHGRALPGFTVRYSYSDPQYRGRISSFLLTDTKGEVPIVLPVEHAKTLVLQAYQGNRFSDPHIRPVNGRAIVHVRRVALGSVEGVVRDNRGRPVSNAIVSISASGEPPFLGDLEEMGAWEMRTGPDGRYRWTGVYPGIDLTVMARKQGHADTQGRLRTGSGQNEVPPLTLAPGSFVAGRVVDQHGTPIAKARVYAERVLRVKDHLAETDTNGRFRIERLPLGKVKLGIFKGYNEVHPTAQVGTDATYTLPITNTTNRKKR